MKISIRHFSPILYFSPTLSIIAMTVSLLAASGVHADAPVIKDSLPATCFPSLKLEDVIRASQGAPHLGNVPDGGEVMPGTSATAPNTSSPSSSDAKYRIRMVYRPMDVRKTESPNFVDMTIFCQAHRDQNLADYREDCSLVKNDKDVKNVGMLDYQTRTIIRENTDPACRTGVSLSFTYALQPDPDYAKRVWPIFNLVTDQAIDENLRPSLANLFKYWVKGFTTP